VSRTLSPSRRSLEEMDESPARDGQLLLPGVDIAPVTVASPSALDRYRHCPRLYKLLYVDRLWEATRTSGSQSFGTSIHNALREFFRLPPHRRSLEVLEQRFDAAWVKEGYDDRAHRDRERRRGLDALRAWYERTDTTVVPHATELGLSGTWGDITLKGRVDRIDRTPDGLRVVDYKTGMRPVDQARADADPALTVYAALVQRRLGEPVASLVLDYVVAGVQVTTTRGPILDERLAEVLATATAIRTDNEFRPRTGPWCRRCDLLSRCGAGRLTVAELDAVPPPDAGEPTPPGGQQ
jgi:putative RecB family exonuclease